MIAFTGVMFWERNIPIYSLGFWGVLLLLYLYKKLKKHQSISFIEDALELDKKIIALFSSTEHYLYIVTHNFLLGDNRLKSIYKAKDNGASVSILVNSEALLNTSTIDEFKKLQTKGCDINHNPNLHSKIYLNERSVITGSLNLNINSIKNSLEIGNQTNSLKELKRIEEIIKGYLRDENTKTFTGKIEEGYCIRTKARIPLNPQIPISKSEWFRTKDRNGNYCHQCSEKSDTNLDLPMCGGEVCKND
jgi:phosphatidylserine/phosphatidylglycerophosphate/cardiolipin synthase-like enzyme|tara:strand:+ start:130 stop:873 length:744 start_codon:yes stop_codon:yes gene_type:complete